MKKSILLFSVCFYSQLLGMATTNYRPDLKLPETLLGKEGAQSIQFTYAHGSASHSFDSFEKDTESVLALGGSQAFFRSDLARDAALLADIPSTTSFLGTIELDGGLTLNQFTLTSQTNIKRGLFFELYFIADAVQLKDIHVKKISDSPLSEILQTELADYFAQTYPSMSKRILTTTFLYTGWVGHYQNFDHLDFLDTTAKIGLVSRFDEQNMFKVTHQDLQDWGIPVSGSVSVGLYDWITLGLHAGTIIFLPQTQNYELNETQYDDVLFPQTLPARKIRRPFITVNPYIKADHIAGGLSLSFGFVYAEAFKSTYNSVPNMQKNTTWNSGNIHCLIEYDFATQHHTELPCIQFIYTQPVYGNYIAKTHLYGGTFGVIFKYSF